MAKKRIIRRTMQQRELQQIAHPRIITNQPGAEQDFRPLPTARRGVEHSISWQEAVIQRAAPKVLTNELRLTTHTQAAVDVPNIESIARLSLPIAMPVAVTLALRLQGAFALEPESHAAVAARTKSNAGAVVAEGRFIVQYGVGDWQTAIATDLNDGTIQIPSAQFVNVFAWYGDDTAGAEVPSPYIAGASLRPGHTIANPEAYYTTIIETAAGVNFSTDADLPRGARRYTLTAKDGAAGSNVLFDNDGHAFLLEPPAAAGGQALPYAPRDVPAGALVTLDATLTNPGANPFSAACVVLIKA